MLIFLPPPTFAGELANQFTISIWVNPTTSIATKALVVKDTEVRLVTDASGNPACQIYASGAWQTAVTSSTALSLNTWTHVSCTYNKANMYVYINGVQTGSGAQTNALNDAATNLLVGQDDGGTYANFIGTTDNLMVYNYARTTKQIVEDMNAGHPNVGSPVGSAVGYWKFDEGADNTCSGGTNDVCNSGSGGSTYDGAFTGGVSWSNSGKFGKALSFDGTDDVVTTPAISGASNFTVSTWINPTFTNQGTIVNPQLNCNLRPFDLRFASSELQFNVHNTAGTCGAASATYATSNISTSTWYHIVGTFDGTYARLYVNSNLVSTSSAFSGTLPTSGLSSNLIGGGNSASTWLTGLVDEVKVYNYALTADEIKVDMNRGSSQVLGTLSDKSTPTSNQAAGQIYCIPGDTASCASPIAEWNFEEGTGTSANDNTGNAHTGTWQGTATNLWKPGKYGSGGNFNGTNNYLDLANYTDFGVSAATVSFWVKATTDDSGSVFSTAYFLGAPNNARLSEIKIGQNADSGLTNELISFRRMNNAQSGDDVFGYTTATRTELFDGKWHFVTMTFSGSSNGTNIYLDGVSRTVSVGIGTDSGKFQGGTSVGTNQALIGASLASDSTATNFLDSGTVIDQVRFYNYARTPAQVAWDYNFGKPVGHWKFNECQGSVANDSSGNSLTGTLTATSTIGTCTTSSTFWGGSGGTGAGKFNYAPTFNGTGDYFTVGNTGKTINSVSLWVKPSSTTQNILDLDGGTHTITVASGTISANGFSSPTIYVDGVATSTLPDTNWHLITVTTATGFSASSMVIGKVSTNYYSGQIDETQIYTYALTATQVKTLYNQGSAVRFGPTTGAP